MKQYDSNGFKIFWDSSLWLCFHDIPWFWLIDKLTKDERRRLRRWQWWAFSPFFDTFFVLIAISVNFQLTLCKGWASSPKCRFRDDSGESCCWQDICRASSNLMRPRDSWTVFHSMPDFWVQIQVSLDDFGFDSVFTTGYDRFNEASRLDSQARNLSDSFMAIRYNKMPSCDSPLFQLSHRHLWAICKTTAWASLLQSGLWRGWSSVAHFPILPHSPCFLDTQKCPNFWNVGVVCEDISTQAQSVRSTPIKPQSFLLSDDDLLCFCSFHSCDACNSGMEWSWAMMLMSLVRSLCKKLCVVFSHFLLFCWSRPAYSLTTVGPKINSFGGESSWAQLF